MKTLSDGIEFSDAVVSSQTSADPFDTRLYFDRWLQDFRAGRESLAPADPVGLEESREDKQSEEHKYLALGAGL